MRKIIVSLIIFLALFLAPSVVQAKDYSIQSVDFIVQINKDGSASVTEKRTYNFDGSFTWADEWIPTKSYKLKDIKLIGADSFTTEVTEDKTYIKWFYNASNETNTFTLYYTILDAVTNHSDISEFYWQLIGDEWEKGVENVTAKVLLYEDAKDNIIYGFGHGPLNGVVSIPNSKEVNFSATDLPPKKMFEVRTLFPKGTLVGGRAGSLSLEDILNEEKEFGLKTQNQSRLQNVILLLLSVFVVYRIIVWIKRWVAYGKDNMLPEVNSAGLLHEPPSDLAPIYVETLMKGNPSNKSIVATILELVRNKNLEIKFIKNGKKTFFGHSNQYLLVLKNKQKLNKPEKLLLNWIV